MCYGVTVTAAMVAAGGVAAVVTVRRGDPPAVPLTLAWFSLMEALQLSGWLVVDRCGTPANETVTFLSMLHIILQPLFINAFAMELAPRPVSARMRWAVFGLSGVSVVVGLMQVYPFAWAGTCTPGAILCGPALCTVSGDWHIAWNVPYNGLLAGLDRLTGLNWGFYGYMLAVFGLPLLYGAWRFTLFHALAGPILAGQLTTNPNEVPAIWCLFSIGLLLMGLSPALRRRVAGRPQPA
ncbi:MAG: hypothetical protein IE927_09290 [Rhodobacterales bacterium]|nr:hypothetical protein [Rhodobacterales bacterium]